jgi:ABC-type antimicrobial peptide transport system permease subunit
MVIVARTVGDPTGAATAMRQIVRSLDAEVPVSDLLTAGEMTRRWLRDDQVMAWFLSAMAALALSLSVVGLYGLMSQLVIQRTREIGVRLAIGATPADIRRMVLLRSSRLAATGLVIGAVVSVPVGLAMATQLYAVGGTDPRSFALVAGLLLATGVLAGYLPARRAARIDPITTLRCE